MKGLKKANFTLGLIVGILFICFGLFFLLVKMAGLPNLGVIPGASLAAVALVRLVLIALPASGPGFSGSRALEIACGILEILFGLLFVLNEFVYIELFYLLAAGLIAVLAVVRIRQGALIRRQGFAGMSAYLFIGILLLAAAAGIVLDMVWIKAELLAELTGAAALLYGVFLFSSSFFKQGKPADPKPEEGGAPGAETRAEKNSV